MRRLLAEGRSGTYEKAELAAHLLNLNFNESDSVQAAEECSSIYTAIHFLQQDCELCAEKYPMKKVGPVFLVLYLVDVFLIPQGYSNIFNFICIWYKKYWETQKPFEIIQQ